MTSNTLAGTFKNGKTPRTYLTEIVHIRKSDRTRTLTNETEMNQTEIRYQLNQALGV